MIERHGGLWVGPEYPVVFERYDPRSDRIALVCRRMDGHFEAWLYEKGPQSPLYCLPFWEPINEKVVLLSEEEAMAYLSKLWGDSP